MDEDYQNDSADLEEAEISKAFVNVFKTHNGKVVMKYLKDCYDGSTVVAGDSVQTYGLSQAREVYLEIKRLSEDES